MLHAYGMCSVITCSFRKQRLVEDAGVVDSSGPSMIIDKQSSTCHAPSVIYMTSGTKKRGQLPPLSADHKAGSRCSRIRHDDGMRYHEGT